MYVCICVYVCMYIYVCVDLIKSVCFHGNFNCNKNINKLLSNMNASAQYYRITIRCNFFVVLSLSLKFCIVFKCL